MGSTSTASSGASRRTWRTCSSATSARWCEELPMMQRATQHADPMLHFWHTSACFIVAPRVIARMWPRHTACRLLHATCCPSHVVCCLVRCACCAGHVRQGAPRCGQDARGQGLLQNGREGPVPSSDCARLRRPLHLRTGDCVESFAAACAFAAARVGSRVFHCCAASAVRATVPSFCNSATHRGTRRSERKSRRTSARSTSSRRLDVASACVVHCALRRKAPS